MDGKRTRFEALVLPHLDAAYRFAVSLTRSRPDAEDLVQEASLRAYRGIEKFRGTDAKAWLLAIVRNCYFTAWAQEKKRASIHVPGDGERQTVDALIEPSADPAKASLTQDERRAVGESLAKLSMEHREVLVLREIEDLSYREIAGVTGLPIGTVMSRLARARTALREQWVADHGEPQV